MEDFSSDVTGMQEWLLGASAVKALDYRPQGPGSGPTGQQVFFLALESTLTNECMYSLRCPSSEMYTKPSFPGYWLVRTYLTGISNIKNTGCIAPDVLIQAPTCTLYIKI